MADTDNCRPSRLLQSLWGPLGVHRDGPTPRRADAFEEFFDGHFPRLLRFALARLGGNLAVAEDVVQSTLCRAIDRLHTYRAEATLFTWLCTLCRHEISDHFGRMGIGVQVDLVEDSLEIRAVLESLAAASLDHPERAARRPVRALDVLRGRRQPPEPEQRRPHHVPGLGHDRTTDSAAFLSGLVQPFERLSATAGLRVEHSTASGRTHVSPRASASFRLTDAVRLNGAAALVYQPIPAEFLAVDPRSIALRDMRAAQYSLGMSFTGWQGWRATIEAYDKEYDALPIAREAQHRLILDREPFRDYTIPFDLIDVGTGRARGVELMLERRSGRRFSGVAVASISRNRYRDGFGTERNRLYDNRYAFTLAADYRPSDAWNLSGTLVVQGGTPYTPTREDLSAAWGFWVRRGSQYNAVRYPAYASLNVRAERRFTVGPTTIAVFADVWNLLNRQNVGWIKGWNPMTGDEFEYQMPRTPFIGAGIVF